ncbi:FAD-dependent oxidoreductase [Petrimonas sulfuriphila]|jgi:hypothetical protein|uniref:FAD-dependent oxidoreductase n=1 Tax=Petrimonas sulfuriphila TaxID=285070 RepID=UPI0032443DA3
MKRRNFIKFGALTAFTSCSTIKPHVYQPTREGKTVNDFFDVIVCGGGPAGIAAAVSAARSGAKTCLIELYGCLGGVWTTGMLSNIIDHNGKLGIMAEILKRLDSTKAQLQNSIYDAEAMKLVLEQMCAEAGVHVRLYTRIVSSIIKGRRISAVITESNSGREIWKAKCFVDATGNGDLSALSGCNFDLGHPVTGKTQPLSLMAIVMGINKEDLIKEKFINGNASSSDNKINLRKEIEKLGFSPSYGIPTFFAIRSDLIAIMANHEYNVSPNNAQQLSDATIQARSEVNKIVNGLRSLHGIWENMRLVATGSQIGIREGRRIKGIYTINKEDMISGARFEDAICRATYMVDIHSLDYNKAGYTTDGINVKPYDIPLRSLIAQDVDGLMMAGRCISGDFFAHASYRVTGNAVAMGEAAGVVTAIASLSNKMPHEVTWISVSEALKSIRR